MERHESHSHCESAARRGPMASSHQYAEDRAGAAAAERHAVKQDLRRLEGHIPVRRLVADEREREDTQTADEWIRQNGGW